MIPNWLHEKNLFEVEWWLCQWFYTVEALLNRVTGFSQLQGKHRRATYWSCAVPPEDLWELTNQSRLGFSRQRAVNKQELRLTV